MKYSKELANPLVFWGGLTLLLLAQLPNLLNQSRFHMDDTALLSPIEQLEAISDYPPKGPLDLQPIRDLTYYIDAKVSSAVGFELFHITNVLIYFGIVYLFFLLSREVIKSPAIGICITAFFALHPINSTAVAWIAARKHLLAVFFTLLITYFALIRRNSGRPFTGPLLFVGYLFGILSHPINALWPTWYGLYLLASDSKNKQKMRSIMLVLVMLISGALLIVITFDYYNNAPNFKDRVSIYPSLHSLAIAPLAVGRYFFNIFLPVKLNLYYAQGSVVNFIGIAFFTVFGWLIYTNRKSKDLLIWSFFGLLPLVVVTALTLTSFISDTYIMTSLVGVSLVTGLLIEKYSTKWRLSKLLSRCLLAAFLLFFFCLTLYRNSLWSHSEKVFKANFASEKSHLLMYHYSNYLLKEDRVLESIPLLVWLNHWSAQEVGVDIWSEFGSDLYYSPRLSIKEKIDIIERFPARNRFPLFSYYRAALQAKAGHFQQADLIFEQIKAKIDYTQEDNAKILAEAQYVCHRVHPSQCETRYSSLTETLKRFPDKYAIYVQRKAALAQIDE